MTVRSRAAPRVEDGDAVEISVQDAAIIVCPQPKRYSIEELAEHITPENRHDELDWGTPVGKEVW